MPNGDTGPSVAFLSSEADGGGKSVDYTGLGQVWKKKQICSLLMSAEPSRVLHDERRQVGERIENATRGFLPWPVCLPMVRCELCPRWTGPELAFVSSTEVLSS